MRACVWQTLHNILQQTSYLHTVKWRTVVDVCSTASTLVVQLHLVPQIRNQNRVYFPAHLYNFKLSAPSWVYGRHATPVTSFEASLDAESKSFLKPRAPVDQIRAGLFSCVTILGKLHDILADVKTSLDVIKLKPEKKSERWQLMMHWNLKKQNSKLSPTEPITNVWSVAFSASLTVRLDRQKQAYQ